MFKGKRKSFQAFHKFQGEEVSNLGVQSVAPTWKQLGFMYLVLLFKLEGLLTFYFYRAQKKREREPCAHRVPKKTPAPPSEGLCLSAVGRGPPAPGTPEHGPPACDARPAWPAANELGQDHFRPQHVSGDQAGQSSSRARASAEAAEGTEWRLSKNKPRPGHQPRNPKFSPWGRRLCQLSQSAGEAQHRSEMSTKPNRPSQDTSAPSADFKESPSIGRGDSRTPGSSPQLHFPSAVHPGGGPGQCGAPI